MGNFNTASEIGTSLCRPVVSPDDKLLAFISLDCEIHIIYCTPSSSNGILFKRVSLPRTLRQWLANAEILRSSQDTTVSEEQATTKIELNTSWLLVSDGDRLVIINIELRKHEHAVSTSTHTETQPETGNVLADYQLGSLYGKISMGDFVFSHRCALILFDTSSHVSLLSLNSTEIHQIPNPKVSDSRGFTKSPDDRYFAILLRSKGQDLINVFTLKQNKPEVSCAFSPKTIDAQSILWSPNGDPIIAIVDAAAYGTKVVFFTATGQPLNHLELSTLSSRPTLGLGVTTFKWLSRSEFSTVLLASDGEKNVLVRQQDKGSTKTTRLFYFTHPDTIDGSRSLVYQETLDNSGHGFSPIKTALSSSLTDPSNAEVDTLTLSAEGDVLCTKISGHPKAIWIWKSSDGSSAPPVNAHSVLIFRHPVIQILFHPRLTGVLLVVTAQRDPIIYVWHQEQSSPPAVVEIPLPSPPSSSRPVPSTSTKLEAHWLTDARNPLSLLLTAPHAFQLGFLSFTPSTIPSVSQNQSYRSGQSVEFHSLLTVGDEGRGVEDERETEEEEMDETPSKPAKKKSEVGRLGRMMY